ncbi:MAG TPA: 4-(cytidine 5'-diphospho)-2-C-methyl-D-erythritol kinase [Tepidisphaeraceae bacterium]|jgi:4-diphosphocytidyl-2-C-methyl-D-erythritol kinase
MQLLAPAKLNLHLRVAPLDSPGFHPVMTWMCTVGALFDTLTIRSTEDAPGTVSLLCDDPNLPCDQTNLVVRAVDLMRHDGAPANHAVAIQLQKRIPTGGGLGGGSSDAARTLLGLNRLWKLNWSLDRLSRLSAVLGSDVPFFLYGPSSICTGRGQFVRPIAPPKPKAALIFLPGIAVPTAPVYRKFDQMGLGDEASMDTQPPWQQWADLSAGPLLAKLVNDLETPAFAICPKLANLREEMEQSLGRIVRMSGSGSSLFTLFDDLAEAKSAVARIGDRHNEIQAVATSLAPPTIEDDLASA